MEDAAKQDSVSTHFPRLRSEEAGSQRKHAEWGSTPDRSLARRSIIPASLEPSPRRSPSTLSRNFAVNYACDGETRRSPHAHEGECGPGEPGHPHACTKGRHRKRQLARGTRSDDASLAAERPPDGSIPGRQFPFASAGGVLRAGREGIFRNRAVPLDFGREMDGGVEITA